MNGPLWWASLNCPVFLVPVCISMVTVLEFRRRASLQQQRKLEYFHLPKAGIRVSLNPSWHITGWGHSEQQWVCKGQNIHWVCGKDAFHKSPGWVYSYPILQMRKQVQGVCTCSSGITRIWKWVFVATIFLCNRLPEQEHDFPPAMFLIRWHFPSLCQRNSWAFPSCQILCIQIQLDDSATSLCISRLAEPASKPAPLYCNGLEKCDLVRASFQLLLFSFMYHIAYSGHRSFFPWGKSIEAQVLFSFLFWNGKIEKCLQITSVDTRAFSKGAIPDNGNCVAKSFSVWGCFFFF